MAAGSALRSAACFLMNACSISPNALWETASTLSPLRDWWHSDGAAVNLMCVNRTCVSKLHYTFQFPINSDGAEAPLSTGPMLPHQINLSVSAQQACSC